MADRRSVRAELERKRIQLAQMRQERERRSQMLQESDNSPRNPEDADSVLHALGLSASLSRASTAPSNVSSLDQTRNIIVSPDISQQQHASSLNDSTSIREQLVEESPKTPLQVVHVNQINIPPKEKVYHTKSTLCFKLSIDC